MTCVCMCADGKEAKEATEAPRQKLPVIIFSHGLVLCAPQRPDVDECCMHVYAGDQMVDVFPCMPEATAQWTLGPGEGCVRVCVCVCVCVLTRSLTGNRNTYSSLCTELASRVRC